MKSDFERFWSKVEVNDSCWEWTGAKYRAGYGHFRRKIKGKWIMYKAHRFSYEYYNKPIPQGLLILHTCDNPSCVNPNHLWAGTSQDNTRDAILKGRLNPGRNPKHKWLSLETAITFRNFAKENPHMNQKEMALVLGTSRAQLSRVLAHKIWKEES